MLVVASVVGGGGAVPADLQREWGAAAVWPSRAFAVLAAGPIFTGTYSYAAGFAMLLATIAALQSRADLARRRLRRADARFQPAGLHVPRHRARGGRGLAPRRSTGGPRCSAPASRRRGRPARRLRLFPMRRPLPVPRHRARHGARGCRARRHSSRSRPRGGDPRRALRLLAARPASRSSSIPDAGRRERHAPALRRLPADAADGARRALPAALASRSSALALALAYNVVPYANAVSTGPTTRASRPDVLGAGAHASCTSTAAAPSGSRSSRPPTTGRPGGIPRAGFPLARGWYRQIDIAENGALYRDPLSPAGYRHWLRRMAVRYVMLPALPLGQEGRRPRGPAAARAARRAPARLPLARLADLGGEHPLRCCRPGARARRRVHPRPHRAARHGAGHLPAGRPLHAVLGGEAGRRLRWARADGMTRPARAAAGPPAARRGGRPERTRRVGARRHRRRLPLTPSCTARSQRATR